MDGSGRTTDQLRTTTAGLSASQRSTVDTALSGSRSTTAKPDLGVKGLPWSIDFGSLRIGSDLRFRNGADSHEAAAKESTYA
jgi:hypothetical protein